MTKPKPEYSDHSQFKLLQIMPAEGTLAIYKRDGEPEFDEPDEADLWAGKLDMLGLAVVTTRHFATTWDEAGKPTRLEYQKDVENRVVGVCMRDGFFDVCETARNFVSYFKPNPSTSPDEQRLEIAESFCWKPGQQVTVMLPDDASPVLVTYRE